MLKSFHLSLRMNGKSGRSQTSVNMSTVTQKRQVVNMQKGRVIFLASHDACLLIIFVRQVIELINLCKIIKLVMTVF